MIAFDNTVTTPSASKVNDSQYEMGKTLAEWRAKKLDGKGNVIMVIGVAGTEVDLDRNNGAEDVWAKNPGIKVVNRYTARGTAPRRSATRAAILPPCRRSTESGARRHTRAP